MDSPCKLEKPEPKIPWLCSCRLALALLGFVGFANMYALKVDLSVAIVCMVNSTIDEDHRLGENYTEHDGPMCTEDTSQNTTQDKKNYGEFYWNKETQGIILGAFFYGYIITQIPGGWLASHFGGKRVFGWFMFMCAVATVLCPIGARTHYGFLVALRIIAGFGQGVVWPAMHSLWSYWAPPDERSTLIGFTFAGSQVGNLITFPVSAVLCEYGFDGGWPSVFYVLGGLGILWFIVWMVFVSDSPDSHPRISELEKIYIQESLRGQMHAIHHGKVHIPWLEFLRSPPVWGIVITHMCANWMTYLFLTTMPTYMKEVLHFDIKANGALSALPYIGMWVTIMISGVVADAAIKRKWLSITAVRKVSITIGELLPAIAIIILGFLDCTQSTLAVIVLTLGISFSGSPYGAGYMVNHADIAPKYSPMLFGISNSAATIPGFVAPYVVGILTKNHSREEWQVVFYITSGIVTFGWIFYLITGSGELQSWAKEDEVLPGKDLEQTINNSEPEGKSSGLETNNNEGYEKDEQFSMTSELPVRDTNPRTAHNHRNFENTKL